jgi:probable phosphoglycerate mutase
MRLTLYLLRHGETQCSRNHAFCGADSELTPEGVEMANAFAATYSSTSWQAIFSSPMRRTMETAKHISKAIGIQPELLDGLREINYGQWEGKTGEVISRQHHDDYIWWSADPAWYAPNGGELTVTIASRAMQVIEEIKHLYSSRNVLFVSHTATIRIILCSLLGIDVGRFRYLWECPVGSVSIIEFTEHGPILQTLADRTHLNVSMNNKLDFLEK